MKNLVITIKTLFGLESALQEELIELGYTELEVLNRAVQLKGDWEDVYRLNYRCRVAISVLVEIKSFRIHNEDDLYKKAKQIDWTSYFDIDKTFAVKGAVFSTMFKHSQFPMLLVKDAIVDVFRDKFDKRPNVNVKAPQVMFDVYINDKSVTISLNTSGLPLFQRGWRQETGEAPMNEVLAAGILRLSGWDRKSTLIDPMCGAGTIAIEAALLAADIPSMIERTHYAFKNFKSYDEAAWERVQEEGNKRPIDLGFDILAYDIDGEMLLKAKRNSRVAPIGNMIQFERQDALTLEAPDQKGTLICNPPYEERMGENVEELYEGLGNLFKHSFVGYNCWIVSANMEALKNVGLRPSKRIKVFNGNLECSLRLYEIFEGTIKEQYENADEGEESNGEIKKGSRPADRPKRVSKPRRIVAKPMESDLVEEKKEEKPKRTKKIEKTQEEVVKPRERRENLEEKQARTETPRSSKYGQFSKYQFGATKEETSKGEASKEQIAETEFPKEKTEPKGSPKPKRSAASKYAPRKQEAEEVEADKEEVSETKSIENIEQEASEDISKSKYSPQKRKAETLKERIERIKRERNEE